MLDLSRKAASKIVNVRREEYDRDENLRLALAHLLQAIGEAARRVSREYQKAHREIPWGGIVGMRHKVVHDVLEPARTLLLGMSTRQRLLLVVHVDLDESTIRIISARRATSRERRRYEEEGH